LLHRKTKKDEKQMSIFNDRILELLQTENKFGSLLFMVNFGDEIDKDLEVLEDWGHFIKEFARKKGKTKDEEQLKIMQRELAIMTCESYQSVHNLGIIVLFVGFGNVEFSVKAEGLFKMYCTLKHANAYADVLTEQAEYYPIVGEPCFCGK